VSTASHGTARRIESELHTGVGHAVVSVHLG
jgi:hypothetical protein